MPETRAVIQRIVLLFFSTPKLIERMPYCTDQHRTTEKGIRFKLRGGCSVHQAIIGYIVDRVKVIRKSRTSHIGIGRGQRYGERNQQRSEQKDAAQTSQMMFLPVLLPFVYFTFYGDRTAHSGDSLPSSVSPAYHPLTFLSIFYRKYPVIFNNMQCGKWKKSRRGCRRDDVRRNFEFAVGSL